MILLIDNYDSFTHNLYQYLREVGEYEVEVVRNDRITLEEIEARAPRYIVISPGPGGPQDAGISLEVVRRFAGRVPILGVCLGHQVIAEAYGARVVPAERIVHGRAEPITIDGHGLFRSIGSPAAFTRYHSLIVDPDSLPAELEPTAWSATGELMGLRHRRLLLEGVQFHPESIASEDGKKLLRNFLQYRREPFVAKSRLARLIDGHNMSQEEAESFMEELTEGNLSTAQVAAFLTALAAKGPSPEEIAGCASVLRRKRVAIHADRPLLDTCGTGGDGRGTFNISSFSALVAAACGAAVAKHGNRAVSSRSGSAEFYRELGVPADLSAEHAERLLNETGFAFLFAPTYHGAMKHAAPARKELGLKTIMNLLGPLANPAAAEFQLIGVYAEELCEPVARAAQLLGVRRGMVVHGLDGIDELSPAAPSRAVCFDDAGRFESLLVEPERFGLGRFESDELTGGDAAANAADARELLAGGGRPALRAAVLLNAGAALQVYGVAETIEAGVQRAAEALADGSVRRKLEELRAAAERIVAEPRGVDPGGAEQIAAEQITAAQMAAEGGGPVRANPTSVQAHAGNGGGAPAAEAGR